ncbi:hypothetical protein [Methylotenera sp.]|uniref:hypothetical protein n=1 Tax=Methylotenera sp. TaxID=2051956 RepID=UPI00248A6EBE|nr:hypothetical protein [Methylotenera sp.]MDI1361789.1 hypothetical protein [Methylotenera sp.]
MRDLQLAQLLEARHQCEKFTSQIAMRKFGLTRKDKPLRVSPNLRSLMQSIKLLPSAVHALQRLVV